MVTRRNMVLCSREEGRDLSQPCDKNPHTNGKFIKSKATTQRMPPKSSITQRLQRRSEQGQHIHVVPSPHPFVSQRTKERYVLGCRRTNTRPIVISMNNGSYCRRRRSFTIFKFDEIKFMSRFRESDNMPNFSKSPTHLCTVSSMTEMSSTVMNRMNKIIVPRQFLH